MRAAAAVSSRGDPGKPTVNALKFVAELRAIAAATAEESTPPERKAPTGTSESICLLDGIEHARARLLDPVGLRNTGANLYSRLPKALDVRFAFRVRCGAR